MSETIRSLLELATKRISKSSSARLDSELLLQSVLQSDRAYLYSHSEQQVSNNHLNQFLQLLNKRQQGIPIAYLSGHKEFWSLDLSVTENTLIPRPETELLVETALKNIEKDQSKSILDLGTGSGAIALAIAYERPKAQITATDNSESALATASNNAEELNINNINFINSDWFDNLSNKIFDIIISNPPYIKEDDPHLEQGDVRFEPKSALVAGKDGLSDLKTIISNSMKHLNSSGNLIVEHGYDQGAEVIKLMMENGFEQIDMITDLAGHHRATHTIKI